MKVGALVTRMFHLPANWLVRCAIALSASGGLSTLKTDNSKAGKTVFRVLGGVWVGGREVVGMGGKEEEGGEGEGGDGEDSVVCAAAINILTSG